MRFQPKQKIETPDGVATIKFLRNAPPDFKEVDKVVCDVEGIEREYSPDSVKLLEDAPETKREPKKAKTVRLNVAFQNADGSLLPKSEFLALMGTEYDRLKEEMFGGSYEDIAAIIHKAFDTYPGANLNLKLLHSCVVKELQPDGVDAWKKMDRRFNAFFEQNVGEGKPFAVQHGRNGGHYRVADKKAEPQA